MKPHGAWTRRGRRVLTWCGSRFRRLPWRPGAVLGLFCDFEGHHGGRVAERSAERGCERLLDLLDAQDLRITFNIVADLCESHPRRIERIARAGHEIACHGWRHERPRDLTATEVDAMLQSASGCFAKLNLTPTGFRSPQSAWSVALLRKLRTYGYRWNAERDLSSGPYRIQRNLIRVGVTSDDWDLADGTGDAESLLEKWRNLVNIALRRQTVVCLGLHEWILGTDDAYAAGLNTFLDEMKNRPGLRISTLGRLAVNN